MLSSQTRVTSSSQRQSELRQTYLRILPSMQCNYLDSLMFPSACLSEGWSYWSFSPRLRQSGDVTMVTTSETPSPAPNFLVLVKHVFSPMHILLCFVWRMCSSFGASAQSNDEQFFFDGPPMADKSTKNGRWRSLIEGPDKPPTSPCSLPVSTEEARAVL
jgi:hypothetical protein